MRTQTHPKPLLTLFIASALVLCVSCKVEETVKLEPDGSGLYTVRFSIQKSFGDAIGEVRSKLEQQGLEIVDSGTTESEAYVVASKSFQDIAEVGGLNASFMVQDQGLFRKRFFLHLNVEENLAAQNVERVLTLEMPGDIASASAGTARDRTIEWECSAGGVLDAEATALMPPGGNVTLYAAAGLVLLGLGIPLGKRLQRHRSRVQEPSANVRCGGCGWPVAQGATFCTSCGRKLSGERV